MKYRLDPAWNHFSYASPVLTNPVAACGSLQVILRVEVTIHKNDSVSSCQVHPYSPCKDRGKEQKLKIVALDFCARNKEAVGLVHLL